MLEGTAAEGALGVAGGHEVADALLAEQVLAAGDDRVLDGLQAAHTPYRKGEHKRRPRIG